MKVLIVEDEARIAKRIERMTRDFFGDRLLAIHVLDDLTQSIDFLAKHRVDLLLLDLNLSGEDGFDVLQRFVSGPFQTIVVSAYTDKAITAFEYGVLDFVPKPFDEKRLFQAFARASGGGKGETAVRYLAVKKGGQVLLVECKDIRYIAGAGIYTELHLMNGNSEIHEKSLEQLEQLLAASFVRIHKSYLVAIGEIKALTVNSGSKYNLVLKNGDKLPIGRTRYKTLKEKLSL